MGNIFKTLGLDDLARSIPVVGGGIANFLTGLDMGQKNGGSGTGIQFGPNQGRMSNEDYQHNQNLLDSSNPREIARTSSFLEGVAPSQGRAWNTYQDATYGADTQRSIDRTKQTGEQLGMSPWEVMGLQGATPLSPASPTQPKASGESFLGQMTPLAIAKMNNKTAIQQAKIAQDTALQTTAMQTAQADTANRRSTAEGRLPEHQAQAAAAQANAAIAQVGLTEAQTDLQVQDLVLKVIRLAYEILPREQLEGKLDLPGFSGKVTTDVKQGFQQLVGALLQSPTARTGFLNKDDAALQKALTRMPKDQWASIRTAIQRIARGAGDAANTSIDFLGKITK